MSALPPVRTGGKKPPGPAPAPKKAPADAGAPRAAPAAAGPRKAAAGGSTAEDTKARVAREREERMAAVRSAKEDQKRQMKAPPAAAGDGPKTARTKSSAGMLGSSANDAGKGKSAAPASARAAPAPKPATKGPKATPAPPANAAGPKKASPRRVSSDAGTGSKSASGPSTPVRPAPPAAAAGGAKSKAAPAPAVKRKAGDDAPAKEPPARPAKAPPAAPAKSAAPAKASGDGGKAAAKTPPAAPPAKKAPAEPPAAADAGAAAQEKPLAKPREHFKFDGPQGVDVTTEGTKNAVFECFEGDGVCFRVLQREDVSMPRWLFYNDTDDMQVDVEVTFAKGSKLTMLGTAKADDQPDGKILVKDVVMPGKTQPFVEGKVTGYQCAFAAAEVSHEQLQAAVADATQSTADEIAKVEALVKEAKVKADDAESILQLCLRRKVPFVDLSFRPNEKCLFYRDGVDETIEVYPMLRPRQYLPEALRSKVTLINTVEPNDIDQGMLGDCWFLCAISSLAEFPDKVEDVFGHPVSEAAAKQEAAIGAYRVALLHDGWWNVVIVDDYLPSQGGRACFARNIEDPAELWVSLIEKAYAKIRGSFSAIIGGDPLHALEDLTGYPTMRLDRKFGLAMDSEEAADDLFQDLLRFDEAGYLVTIGTPTPDPDDEEEVQALDEKYEEAGLTVDHSYSVIVVKEFKDRGIKLLKIRNPWGNEKEWEGAWGDNSPEWKEHLDIAKECEFDGPSSDGTFWMQWSDALDYFESGGVCFMCNNWHDCRTRGAWKDGVPSVALKVTCRRKTTAFLVLNQASEPGFDPNNAAAKYAGAMVSVWRRDGSTYKVKMNSTAEFDRPTPDFTFLVGRSIGLLYTFEPSTEPYYIVPRVYSADVKKDYRLGIISNDTVGMKPSRAMNVEFVELDKSVKAFENFDTFTMDDPQVRSIDAPYQVNPEVGAPYTDSGPCVILRELMESSVNAPAASALALSSSTDKA